MSRVRNEQIRYQKYRLILQIHEYKRRVEDFYQPPSFGLLFCRFCYFHRDSRHWKLPFRKLHRDLWVPICVLPLSIHFLKGSFMLDTRVRAASPILIISYETFRNYSDVINSAPIGLCICDEVHFWNFEIFVELSIWWFFIKRTCFPQASLLFLLFSSAKLFILCNQGLRIIEADNSYIHPDGE